MINFFFQGLLPSTHSIVALFQDSNGQRELTHEKLINYSRDKEDSRHAYIHSFRKVTEAKPRKNEQMVYCRELDQPEKRTILILKTCTLSTTTRHHSTQLASRLNHQSYSPSCT